jgi:hypothetical protein
MFLNLNIFFNQIKRIYVSNYKINSSEDVASEDVTVLQNQKSFLSHYFKKIILTRRPVS